MAMRIVVRMAELVEASELMDISQAHIDGCGLLSEAGLEFAETLAADGGRVERWRSASRGAMRYHGGTTSDRKGRGAPRRC